MSQSTRLGLTPLGKGCLVVALALAACCGTLTLAQKLVMLSVPVADRTATVAAFRATRTPPPTWTPRPSRTPRPSTTTPRPSPTFSREAFNTGASEEVTVLNSRWQVLSVEFLGDIDETPNRYVPFNEGSQPTQGNFILVRMRITNLTNAYAYANFSPVLIDSDRGWHDPVSSLLSLLEGGSDCGTAGLRAGEKLECSAVYEVPVDVHGTYGVKVGSLGLPTGAQTETIVFSR